MKVLHICNDFCYSKVHSKLYKELASIGIKQTVFAFYGGENREGRNGFEAEGTNIVYKNILRPHHRFLYHNKIKTTYRALMEAIRPQDYDLCHAISVFTNGPIAYKLKKDFGIPYIVAVRNTDINAFLNFAPHAWPLGLKVLLNAERIVFISPALRDSFCKHPVVKLALNRIEPKFILQPNGIDDYWIDNVKKGAKPNNHNIIYVGRFDTNKNVPRLLKAVLSLREKFPEIQMYLVGGGDTRHEEVMKFVNQHKDVFHYLGKIYEEQKLSEIYQKCSIFAMTSFYETFGLVYLEALSQNLAVVFTRHQGIDGLFDKRVGENVNAHSQKSIADAIELILNNREKYLAHEVIDFEEFRWSKIAYNYKNIFAQVISRKNG